MRFFERIDPSVDIAPLLAEIESHEPFWMHNTSRQDNVECQRKTNTIFIRSAMSRFDVLINDNQESQWTEDSAHFPLARQYMEGVAAAQGGTLSRATIVRLAPNSQVDPHIDAGAYYLIRKRFHLVLKSTQGSLLLAGDEHVVMKEGELWWFDNKQHHAAINKSEEWRTHYIFDVLPDEYSALAKNAEPPSHFFKPR